MRVNVSTGSLIHQAKFFQDGKARLHVIAEPNVVLDYTARHSDSIAFGFIQCCVKDFSMAIDRVQLVAENDEDLKTFSAEIQVIINEVANE